MEAALKVADEEREELVWSRNKLKEMKGVVDENVRWAQDVKDEYLANVDNLENKVKQLEKEANKVKRLEKEAQILRDEKVAFQIHCEQYLGDSRGMEVENSYASKLKGDNAGMQGVRVGGTGNSGSDGVEQRGNEGGRVDGENPTIGLDAGGKKPSKRSEDKVPASGLDGRVEPVSPGRRVGAYSKGSRYGKKGNEVRDDEADGNRSDDAAQEGSGLNDRRDNDGNAAEGWKVKGRYGGGIGIGATVVDGSGYGSNRKSEAWQARSRKNGGRSYNAGGGSFERGSRDGSRTRSYSGNSTESSRRRNVARVGNGANGGRGSNAGEGKSRIVIHGSSIVKDVNKVITLAERGS